MILINLLPRELRRQEVKAPKIPYRLVAFVIFFIFLLVSVYNLYRYIRIREKYRSYQQQWKQLEKQNAEADSLQKQLGSSVLAEIDFYNTLVDPPLETARVLNLISDLVPPAAWLTELRFERKGSELNLLLNGLSDDTRRDSKLVEIQNFANQVKGEMEKFLVPATSPGFASVGASSPKIKVAVTTTSRKAETQQAEVTQFTATFSTESISGPSKK